eukprot:917659-Alexandrium_andersonii.AAC.1
MENGGKQWFEDMALVFCWSAGFERREAMGSRGKTLEGAGRQWKTLEGAGRRWKASEDVGRRRK